MGNATCKSVTVLDPGVCGPTAQEDVRAIDLLLVLTKAAATSTRRKTILGPFPKPCVKKFGRKDYDKAADVATRMPRARSLMVENERTKEGNATAASPTAISPTAISPTTVSEDHKTLAVPTSRKTSFDVAKWAIEQAPSSIFPLEGGVRFANIKTPFQFLLKHNVSSHEAKFRKARNSGQTTLAFHGSRIENWHSIFHNGLMVNSGKSGLQLNGAAYGSGIYVSQNSSKSMGYCGGTWKYNGVCASASISASYNAPQTLLSDDATCGIRVLALCEITGHVKKSEPSIWVVPKASQIVVRALFVFTASSSPPCVLAGDLRSDLLKAAKTHNV